VVGTALRSFDLGGGCVHLCSIFVETCGFRGAEGEEKEIVDNRSNLM
jgi:hypothetical protein